MKLDIGVSANYPWFGPKFTDLARHIEQLGFESLWTGEHIIIPVDIADPFRYGVPLPKNYKHMPDPFINMAAASAVTTKLKFGLDVCLITQRDLLVFAKEAATLDFFSGGRLEFGLGAGWLAAEYEALGIQMDSAGVRVSRMEEYIKAAKVAFAGGEVHFDGTAEEIAGLMIGALALDGGRAGHDGRAFAQNRERSDVIDSSCLS